MPGAEPHEQLAQIDVVLALGFFLLRFLLLGGFPSLVSCGKIVILCRAVWFWVIELLESFCVWRDYPLES